jgi:hypothetical protein
MQVVELLPVVAEAQALPDSEEEAAVVVLVQVQENGEDQLALLLLAARNKLAIPSETEFEPLDICRAASCYLSSL